VVAVARVANTLQMRDHVIESGSAFCVRVQLGVLLSVLLAGGSAF
jgi:hypothetical protein